MIIDWGHVSEMGQYGITFGSHGLHHYILTTLDNTLKKVEIAESLNKLKKKTNATIPVFSYPNGDWDKASIDLIMEAGYLGALTTKLGCNNYQTPPYLLNRIGLHEYISHTPDLFWFRIFQASCGTIFE